MIEVIKTGKKYNYQQLPNLFNFKEVVLPKLNFWEFTHESKYLNMSQKRSKMANSWELRDGHTCFENGTVGGLLWIVLKDKTFKTLIKFKTLKHFFKVKRYFRVTYLFKYFYHWMKFGIYFM